MQITNILIWQVDNIIRNFQLKENKVNVITGDSGTGKSSIPAIIDYCLLSSSSDGISKTNVDNYVLWYGIRFKLNDNYHVICRKATHIEDDGLVYFNKNGLIPDQPENNIKIDSLKKQLNYEFGINSALKIPYGGRTIQQGSKVSYRYFMPHSLINQTTLTSPEYLYSKPTDLKIKERIERTYDMALGSENAETMIIRTRIEDLRKNLARLEYKQSISQESYLNFEDEIDKLYNESHSLGLIEWNKKDQLVTNEKFNHLQKISNYQNIDEIPTVNEISNLERDLFLLKNELRDIDGFIKNNEEYKKKLKDSQDSLLIAQYLEKNNSSIVYSKNISSIVESLIHQGLEIKKAISQNGSNSLLSRTKEKKKELENSIDNVKKRIEIISIEEIKSPSTIFKFIGKLGAEIKNINVISKYDYTDVIEKTSERIDELSSKFSDNETYKAFTINILNEKIKDILVRMPLKGFKNATPMFNKNKKTIDLVNKEQVEKMIDIGSASNYMYIHIAYFLALHELARERNVLWMPRFLVIDQPSTPYFSSNGRKTNDFDSLDAALYELNSFIDKMEEYGGFQIILLEHIEESYWLERKLNNFRLVDKELRDNYGVIYFS
ncbi:DUF3732 domain-containing protein [Serratia fonticola]|uniref:DUF3732 domain-containing protein n=1 Tax=Serratia fonticola TaxID=47917 RepID=UPI0015C5B07E|nr:DUF3732 domain-containing protein [Serratia fonticola]MBC3382036.1 DUF3732 domain-containing protein [Serratia fonticola]NYA41235.1 DUF3732 domain-containing protein [Serratia fonticola]